VTAGDRYRGVFYLTGERGEQCAADCDVLITGGTIEYRIVSLTDTSRSITVVASSDPVETFRLVKKAMHAMAADYTPPMM